MIEPIGGFPSFIRVKNKKISDKTLESRGFPATNIVDINSIMDAKMKENLFIAFGTEDEEGVDFAIENILDKQPNEYNKIAFNDIPNNKPPPQSVPRKRNIRGRGRGRRRMNRNPNQNK